MRTRTLAIITTMLMLLPIVAAGSMTRTGPSTANTGSSFQITYTASGVSGKWGASIEDSVSGGCTFPSGSNTYKSVMLSEDGTTKTVTITTPSNSGTCVFSGDYKFGTDSVVQLGGLSVAVGSGGTTCTDVCVGGAKECSGAGYRTCGNFDADSCTEWSTVTACNSGYHCSSGSCVQDTPGTVTCYQCDGSTLRTKIVTGSACESGWSATAPTCSGGTTTTTCSTDDECEFYQKCENSKCETNMNFVYIGIGLLAFIIIFSALGK